MKAQLQALEKLLKANKARCYLLSGDEPLLKEEALDKIRSNALKQGFDERLKFTVDSHFNWEQLDESLNSYSLFATKRLIELHFNSAKLSTAAKNYLVALLSDLPEDLFIIMTLAKCDSATLKNKWIKQLESIGHHIQIWPIEEAAFPGWVKQRLKRANIQTHPALVDAICAQTQGNLLAAKQQIALLSLLELPPEQLVSALNDAAKFSSFDFVAKCLSGNLKKASLILEHLQTDGTEPILILWALTQEIRLSIQLLHQMKTGLSFDKACEKLFIWPKRRPPLKHYLKQFRLPIIKQHLQHCAKLDGLIKGQTHKQIKKPIWFALSELTATLSGMTLTHA